MKHSAPILLILAVLALAACDRRPDGVLGKEDMARLLADIHKAEIVAEANTRTYNDSARRVLRQSVYAAHGLTSEEVDSSLSWYGYNMEKYLEVYDRTIEILEEERDKVREKAGSAAETGETTDITFDGDSVDVWTGERFVRFAANQPVEIIPFGFSSDPNWMPGDAYTLKAKIVGTVSPVEVTLVARYRTGPDEYVTTRFNGDGWNEIRLATDKTKDPREIYGFITSRSVSERSAYVDSIQLVRVRQDSPYNEEARRHVRSFDAKRF